MKSKLYTISIVLSLSITLTTIVIGCDYIFSTISDEIGVVDSKEWKEVEGNHILYLNIRYNDKIHKRACNDIIYHKYVSGDNISLLVMEGCISDIVFDLKIQNNEY